MQDYGPTGKRVPLIFSQTLAAAAANVNVPVNPQINFRGENLVIDPTTGALCSVTIPQVGSNPQIAGGTAGAMIPGTMFPPTQTKAMDFGMDIAMQGNAISLNVTSTSTNPLPFVALLWGSEADLNTGGAAGARGSSVGVVPAQRWSGR